MKKITEVYGIILALIIAYSSIAKVMHYPGGALGLVFGIGVLLMPYIVLVIISIYKEYKISIPVLVFSGFPFLIYALGFLFITLHWPGGEFLALVGLLLFLVALFIIAFVEIIKKNDKKISLTIISFSIILVSLIYVASHRTSTKAAINGYVNSIEKMELLREFYKDRNEQLLAEIGSKGDTLLRFHDATKFIIKYIDDVKRELILKAGGQNDNLDEIKAKEDITITNQVMFGENKALMIKNYIIAFKNTAYTLLNDNNFEKFTETQLLNTEMLPVMNGEVITWEESQFMNVPVIVAISNLENIKSGIVLCEYHVLRSLHK